MVSKILLFVIFGAILGQLLIFNFSKLLHVLLSGMILEHSTCISIKIVFLQCWIKGIYGFMYVGHWVIVWLCCELAKARLHVMSYCCWCLFFATGTAKPKVNNGSPKMAKNGIIYHPI